MKTIEFPRYRSAELHAAWLDLISTTFGLNPDDVVAQESAWIDGRDRVVPRLVLTRGRVRLECRLYLRDENGHVRLTDDLSAAATVAYVRTVRLAHESIDPLITGAAA